MITSMRDAFFRVAERQKEFAADLYGPEGIAVPGGSLVFVAADACEAQA